MRNKTLAICFLVFVVMLSLGSSSGNIKFGKSVQPFDQAIIQYDTTASGFLFKNPTEVFHTTPGMVILKVSGTCPPGFTEDTSFDGRALIGTTIANGNVATNTGNATQNLTVANNVTLLGLGSALTGPTSINLTPLSRRVIVCTN